VGFSKVLNFSTSVACPENVYVHGHSNPILKNLLPVTVANSLPPLLRKKINTLLCSMGTCPTHCSLFPSFRNKARQKYNFSFKLRVIKFAEEKGKHAAAKFFNVDRKRVCLPGQLLLISDA
jgi:hypothetical protein